MSLDYLFKSDSVFEDAVDTHPTEVQVVNDHEEGEREHKLTPMDNGTGKALLCYPAFVQFLKKQLLFSSVSVTINKCHYTSLLHV